MSTTEFALTAHLVMPAGFPGDAFLAGCAHGIAHDFGITHATFQVEIGDDCAQRGRLLKKRPRLRRGLRPFSLS